MAIGIVPIILLANLFLGIYHNLAIWYKLTDRTRAGMYISIFGALITIGVNLLLIPKIGFMASAWATLLAYGGMVFISYMFGRKYYPVPYNVKKISFYLILSVGLSIVCYRYFREQYIIATLVNLLFVAVVYTMERKQLAKILSS